MDQHEKLWQDWLKRTPESQIAHDLYKVAKDEDENPPQTFGEFCEKYQRQLNLTLQEKRELT